MALPNQKIYQSEVQQFDPSQGSFFEQISQDMRRMPDKKEKPADDNDAK